MAENNSIFPAVGTQIQYFEGSQADYTSYDIYGFDQYQWMMGIRILNITGIPANLADADHCLTLLQDPSLSLADQNLTLINYMKTKYPNYVPV
jgi:hypothetical protein